MGSRLDKNSTAVRKRIESHSFDDEEGEEYEGSAFGGFPDYFRRKKIKLQNLDADLRASSEGKPQIFKDVVAHVSGYTQPSLNVLHKELVQHGAGFLQYLDGKTMATHIIASSFPPKKSVDYSRYRIVKPAWVVDSIKAGKLLPWNDYRVIDESPRQKNIKFDGGKMFSQSTQSTQRGYREQTDGSFYANQFKKSAAASSSPATPSSKLAHSSIPGVENPEKIDDEAMDDQPGQAPGHETPIKADQSPKDSHQGMPPPETPDYRNQASGMAPPDRVDPISKPVSPSKSREMSSEEHNAWLLSDPRMRKSSTANPNFIQQYYAESRLHHLSTWKAELKSRMQRLASEKGQASKPLKRKPGSRRYIMHVDFDSFFCAVSLKSAPEYVNKPAVVAHGNGTGSEIASCNYPARQFGVKNGMWMKRALELCPDLKVLPYDFPAYEATSRLFYEAILELGGTVQSVSIDEALVDVTTLVLSATGSDGSGVDEGSIWREQEHANEMATNLRDSIKAKTGCNVSIGTGPNILLAKVALRKAKPAGQHQVKPDEALDILSDLKVEELPGVAYSIGGKLEEIGVKFVKDIRELTKERLISVLGPKTGEKLWEYSRGIDKTEVGDQPIRKSVSAEVNWGIRFVNQEEADEFVMNLCKELERRLLNEGVKGSNLTMKIMRRCLDAPLDPAKHLGHGKCDTFNKSITFGVATHNAAVIGKEAVNILRSFNFSPGDLRGLGVQLQKLQPIKASTAAPDGSQRRISFGAFGAASTKKAKQDPIQDDGVSASSKGLKAADQEELDPITDDPLTPRKPKDGASPHALPHDHPAIVLSRMRASDTKPKYPLNMFGTQFVLPTNPDPGILAELPRDIRDQLKARPKSASASRDVSPSKNSIGSRSESPALQDEVPPEIDPDVFAALPDDMKAEILSQYGRKRGQSVLPQSPRKDRVIRHAAPKKTPTKRGLKSIWGKAKERQQDAEAKLLQTNFMSARPVPEDEADEDMDELDPDFLAELPEEVRQELIDDHRRRRLAQRSGLDYQAPRRRGQDVDSDEDVLPGGQTKLQFPALPPKMTFTKSSLTSAPEIKDMLGSWYGETRDEGPHRADVEVFERYLAKVVLEERDMEKARGLVKWLAWMVEDGGKEAKKVTKGNDAKGKLSWTSAIRGIKERVQEAVTARGLGRMSFE